MTEKIVLAFDLGGTNLRMAAIDAEGKILHSSKTETPKTKSAEDIVRAIVRAAQDCRQNLKKDFEIKSLAAAVPAVINTANGSVSKSPNLPALNGFHLSAALENELNLPVILENDANTAAVGEQTFGAAKGFQNAICVMLGTGVGGGIIINGKILRGVDGTAGEIGHLCVEPRGAPCGCGSHGCLEQYASATAIVRLARELENQYPQSTLYKKKCLTSADVYEAGMREDLLALEVFRQAGFYLGIVFGGLINILNTEVIVIGGGVSAAWNLLVPNIEKEMFRRAFCQPAKRVKLVRARLGDDAGILGAAQLAFEQLTES